MNEEDTNGLRVLSLTDIIEQEKGVHEAIKEQFGDCFTILPEDYTECVSVLEAYETLGNATMIYFRKALGRLTNQASSIEDKKFFLNKVERGIEFLANKDKDVRYLNDALKHACKYMDLNPKNKPLDQLDDICVYKLAADNDKVKLARDGKDALLTFPPGHKCWDCNGYGFLDYKVCEAYVPRLEPGMKK